MRRLYALLCALVVVARALGAVDRVPERTQGNVIVACYNIKWLGATPHSMSKLASVIGHFDVCGILEVKREEALIALVGELESQTGGDWGYIHNIRTHRPGGSYHETYGCVWNRSRISLGDGLVTAAWDRDEAFRNDPFFVSFTDGKNPFTILFVHTRWTDDADGSRDGELRAIVAQLEYIRGYLTETDIFVAGDFNYPASSPKMISMANDAGLVATGGDHGSTFKADNSGYASAYDHVYATEEARRLMVGDSQVLDATKLIYGDNTRASMAESKRELSDHLPVFFVIGRK